MAIYMNNTLVGITRDKNSMYDCYREARLDLTQGADGIVMMDFPQLRMEKLEDAYGATDSEQQIITNMKECLIATEVEQLVPAYVVKVHGTMVTLSSANEVIAMLEETLGKYDTEGVFEVALGANPRRELNVLQVLIRKTVDEEVGAQHLEGDENLFLTAGWEEKNALALKELDLQQTEEIGFDSFELGVREVAFSEELEVVRAYLPPQQVMSLAEAKSILTENQEVQQIYEVQPGDTLSEISLLVGLPLDEIIALNDALENENSNIYVNQELLITVPKPELSVVWTVEERIAESYDLEVQYVYNDSWYTNQSVTLQQPSAGYREAIARTTYVNADEIAEEILYEEIYQAAVAKVVEVGTIVPPTYIKPIAGGRLTSSFGRRTAPTTGASTYHRGVDWATPVGTAVCASSGGTVVKAGWASGYGYVVYINHPDGRQTRYGHLSRVNVSVGQSVRQGQVIAASGNTGRSTGPHLHFEILVNGVQVNPFDCMY